MGRNSKSNDNRSSGKGGDKPEKRQVSDEELKHLPKPNPAKRITGDDNWPT